MRPVEQQFRLLKISDLSARAPRELRAGRMYDGRFENRVEKKEQMQTTVQLRPDETVITKI